MRMLVRFAWLLGLIGIIVPRACEGQLLNCTLSGNPVPLRAEGLAEPIGDILIQCLATGPAPAGQSYITGEIQVSLNTNIVNRLGVAGNPNTTDAVLAINENDAPPTANSTLGGPLKNVPVPQFGVQAAVNGLQWTGVQIPIPGATAPDGTIFPSRTTIRVTNIRCNALLLGVSSTLIPTIISVYSVAIADAAPVQGTSKVALSGKVSSALVLLNSNNSGPVLPQCQSQNIVNGQVSGPPTFAVNIAEGQANGFRPLGQPSTSAPPHPGEDGYHTPGIGANGGGADQGTRVELVLSGVPEGVRIAVPSTVQSGTLTLQLTTANAGGGGPFQPVTASGLVELQSSGGTNFQAVYEVVASDSTAFETAHIPVTVGYGANTSVTVVPAVVAVSLAPSSTNSRSNSNGPVPSFGGFLSPISAFSIGQCIGPAPNISSISPTSVGAGLGSDLMIHVSGTNFTSGAVVEWNGVAIPTQANQGALSASIDSSLLIAPGTAQVDVRNSDGQRSNLTSFTVVSVAPAISSGGVVNAASSQPLLAPGSLASVYGTSFATSAVSAASLPLPDQLSETSVLFQGAPAPVFYVSPYQINFQVPFEAATSGSASVVVSRNGSNSAAAAVHLGEFAPGIFLSSNQPIVLHGADYSLVTLAKPAQPNEILIAYGTGIGGLNHSPADGAAAPASPLAEATVTPTITVGSQNAVEQFAGLAPGFVGLAQFNFQMPSSVSSDSTSPLVISFNSAASLPVNLPTGMPTANVQVTFTPNPVSESSDGSWNYSLQLQETSGVGVTITKLVVGGTDLTSSIAKLLGTNQIAPDGTLMANLETPACPSCSLPYPYPWQFAGTDSNGHNVTWSGTLTLAATVAIPPQ